MSTTENAVEPRTAPKPQPMRVSRSGRKPILAVTLGDAAGVGPELCLHLLNRVAEEELPYHVAVIGDIEILLRVSAEMDRDFRPHVLVREEFEETEEKAKLFKQHGSFVIDTPWLKDKNVEPGCVQKTCGKAAGEFIRYAVEGVLAGTFDGILTAPINKESLHLGGFDFPGHTEMLASLAGVSGEEAMLLFSEKISVGFATLHTALSNACAQLRSEEIVRVGLLMNRTLERLYSRPVRLGVLALNPHAGESGLFGREEIEIIQPAIAALEREGVMADGPLVPDAAFVPNVLHRFDGFLCMYHDQGSIPFKMLSFDEGVNLTMGLPLIRTSPDHGTAFDIAWQGIASPSSFFAAADLAGRLMRSDEN
ncbi:MAG: 4-hydroxythreonine-4-phosphate dehydrogenase PdxA [Candidatus Omnitrophica bacterium]|nr:4-hydroxythreonine-4-phosphate dehydrogenase PdxA [Candidatus Omnitrophota bacterium]